MHVVCMYVYVYVYVYVCMCMWRGSAMLSIWTLIQAVSVCNLPPPPLSVQEHMLVQQSGWLQGKSFLRYASGDRSLLTLY